MSLWILEIKFLTIFWVIPDPIRGRIEKPSFQRIFIGGSTWVSIGELPMNVFSIFIWIFLYIHVPMDIRN